MRETTCCFSGHREIDPQKQGEIAQAIDLIINKLYTLGITDYCTGGAMGFDTLAAERVLDFRNRHTDVKLRLFLPCKEQADRWDPRSRNKYNDILVMADEVAYACDHYTNFCMIKRNKMLVDKSSVCIVYLEKQAGGTAFTADCAKKQGLTVINLAKGEHKNTVIIPRQLKLSDLI